MIKDLLGDTCRVGLANIDLRDLKEPPADAKDIQLAFNDRIQWETFSDRLRIECSREFHFEPECNFKLKITYFIEHFLKEPETLDSLTKEDIQNEIFGNLDFYLQTSQGLAERMSMLAAQITSNFGGVPAITPPIFPFGQKNNIR